MALLPCLLDTVQWTDSFLAIKLTKGPIGEFYHWAATVDGFNPPNSGVWTETAPTLPQMPNTLDLKLNLKLNIIYS